MRGLPRIDRAKFSDYVSRARESTGENQIVFAETVTLKLRELAEVDELMPDAVRSACQTIEVDQRNIGYLESCPANPLGKLHRRVILLGIIAIGGLDKDTVSRLGGGL